MSLTSVNLPDSVEKIGVSAFANCSLSSISANGVKTVENGEMTKDLALITTLDNAKTLNTQDFIKAVRATLDSLMA